MITSKENTDPPEKIPNNLDEIDYPVNDEIEGYFKESSPVDSETYVHYVPNKEEHETGYFHPKKPEQDPVEDPNPWFRINVTNCEIETVRPRITFGQDAAYKRLLEEEHFKKLQESKESPGMSNYFGNSFDYFRSTFDFISRMGGYGKLKVRLDPTATDIDQYSDYIKSFSKLDYLFTKGSTSSAGDGSSIFSNKKIRGDQDEINIDPESYFCYHNRFDGIYTPHSRLISDQFASHWYINTYHKPVYVVNAMNRSVICIPPSSVGYSHTGEYNIPKNSLVRIESHIHLNQAASDSFSHELNDELNKELERYKDVGRRENKYHTEGLDSNSVAGMTFSTILNLEKCDKGNTYSDNAVNLNQTLFRILNTCELVTFNPTVARQWESQYELKFRKRKTEEEILHVNRTTFEIAGYNLPHNKTYYYNVNGIVQSIQSMDAHDIKAWNPDMPNTLEPMLSFIITDRNGVKRRYDIKFDTILESSASKAGLVIDLAQHGAPKDLFSHPFHIYMTEADAFKNELYTDWVLNNLSQFKKAEYESKQKADEYQAQAESKAKRQKNNRSFVLDLVDKIIKGLLIVSTTALIAFIGNIIKNYNEQTAKEFIQGAVGLTGERLMSFIKSFLNGLPIATLVLVSMGVGVFIYRHSKKTNSTIDCIASMCQEVKDTYHSVKNWFMDGFTEVFG